MRPRSPQREKVIAVVCDRSLSGSNRGRGIADGRDVVTRCEERQREENEENGEGCSGHDVKLSTSNARRVAASCLYSIKASAEHLLFIDPAGSCPEAQRR